MAKKSGMTLAEALRALAVSSAIKGAVRSEASAKLKEGSVHQVDVAVRIVGSISKGAGSERAPTSSILSKTTLALALLRMGVDAERFCRELAKAAAEALIEDKSPSEELVAKRQKLLVMIDDVERQVVAKLPKKAVEGQVRAVLSVEPLV